MTAFRRRLLLASLALGLICGPLAQAQDTIDQEGPATGGTPNQLPDSTSPGDEGNLFPDSAGQAQQPLLGNRPRTSRLLGNKNKRNARATDLISSEADADPLEVRVAFRRAKTQALLEDPEMADFLARSAAAPTDKQKREWLRQYYTTLFARVLKIDSSPALAQHVALLKLVARQRYDPQRRRVAGEEELVNGIRGRR